MYNERQPELVGAVLDTSVIVSGFRSKRGASAEILRMWREKQNFQLMEGKADYLVSLDRHLLSLKYYQGVQIVWPRDFLKLVRSIE
jgi:predicted nucleic acid-binding protein